MLKYAQRPIIELWKVYLCWVNKFLGWCKRTWPDGPNNICAWTSFALLLCFLFGFALIQCLAYFMRIDTDAAYSEIDRELLGLDVEPYYNFEEDNFEYTNYKTRNKVNWKQEGF